MTQANMPNDIICPHCAEAYTMPSEAEPEDAGQSIDCIHCGKRFTVPPIAKVTAAVPAASTSSATTLPLEYSNLSQLEYSSLSQSPKSGPGVSKIVGITVGVFLGGIVLIAILIPALENPAAKAYQVKCASNLKNIGLACFMYANNQKDRAFPDSFDTLIRVEELAPELFVCPESSDVAASGATPYQISVDFGKGGHCSYVYLGKGQTPNSPPTNVLAYEALGHHHIKGINVLYMDGHVQWNDHVAAQALIAQLQARIQPPATVPASGR